MPKIQRKTQKIFCSNAENDQLAVFGSMVTGNPVYTNDIETLQSNEAYTQGWEAATEEDKAPFMEEMNGLQYGLSKQIAYTFQEGIPEYDANTTYYVGSIVKILNDDNKPVLYTSIIDNNTDNALTDTTSWEELKLGGGAGMPIGTVYSLNCTENYVPEGSLPCNGAEYSKGQFNDLWNNYLISGLLQTCTYNEYEQDIETKGQCSKFAIDTTNQTFKVPFIKNGSVIQQALTNNELGKSYNAGLPNIIGDTAMRLADGMGEPAGAFYSTEEGTSQKRPTYNSLGTSTNAIYFDASRSSSVYKDDVDTVQPNAVALRFFVVVANGSINESQMNWSEWASSLQGKANSDLSNCTKPYVVEVSDKSLLPSWYRIYSDGWCEQGCREVEYGSTAKTITYLITFSSLPSLIVRPFKNSYDTSNVTRRNFGYEDTVEGFTVRAGETTLLGWEAKGYIS